MEITSTSREKGKIYSDSELLYESLTDPLNIKENKHNSSKKFFKNFIFQIEL